MSMLDTPPVSSRVAPAAAIFGTVAAHGLLVVLASVVGVTGVTELKKLLPVTEMVEVDLPAPPPAPAPAPARRAEAPRTRATAKAAEGRPPSAAEAGQLLDAKSEVVDFVTGKGDSFAGGTTDASGTAKTAVQDTSARGSAAGIGTAKVDALPDLSRPAKLMGGGRWNCPFPPEADDAGVNRAVVSLRLELAADGTLRNVSVLADPGNGFAREARRCAKEKRWSAAWDRSGHAIPTVAITNIAFER